MNTFQKWRLAFRLFSGVAAAGPGVLFQVHGFYGKRKIPPEMAQALR